MKKWLIKLGKIEKGIKRFIHKVKGIYENILTLWNKVRKVMLNKAIGSVKMKISKSGLTFLRGEEGTIRYEYYCPANYPTIGVGCLTRLMTQSERDRTGRLEEKDVKIVGYIKPVVKDGFVMVADDELINDMLMRRLEGFENTVNKSIKVEINQNQYDALISFIFNVGITAFKRSTLLKMINRKSGDEAIKYQFMRWVNAGGKPILRKRREKEVELYLNGSIRK